MSSLKTPNLEDFLLALDVIDHAVTYSRTLRNTAAGMCVYATEETRKDADALHAMTNEYLLWLEGRQTELREAEARRQGAADGAALIH